MNRHTIHHHVTPNPTAEWFEEIFAQNGWRGAWRNGIYGWHHYHTTTHEVLGCYAGSARVQLGGPDGEIVDLEAGDVVIIPAGVAHRNLGSTGDFAVVGAYPDGVSPDLQRGPGDPSLDLPTPLADPVLGPGRGISA